MLTFHGILLPMPSHFEELDYQKTPLGELTLRRRRSPALDDAEVYEVKIDEAMLMSSVVNSAEIALSDLALRKMDGPLDIVVGGLGLGYTAQAALDHVTVMRVVVVELLQPVIDWHSRGLVPLGAAMTADPRCHMVQGDFFELMTAAPNTATGPTAGLFHAMLIDIDHSPACPLTLEHVPYYEVESLKRLAARLHPDGVFGLWSADAPEDTFLANLAAVFRDVETHEVPFDNPMVGEKDSNTIYVARM